MRRFGCLANNDNASTWRDHAASSGRIANLYAVGGCRTVTPSGEIVGSFTNAEQVFFFKVPTR